MIIKFLFFVTIFTTCVASRTCHVPKRIKHPSKLNNTEIEGRLDKGSITLSGQFVYQLLDSKPNSNFVLSATSLMIPLAQVTYFATGLVLKQLLKVLNLRSTAEIKSVFPGVIANYENQKDVDFEVASKYYANVNDPLTDNFMKFSLDVFQANGEDVDFSKNVQSAKTINSWVEKKTHDKIKDLIDPGSLSAATKLVVVNAIYFLGNWVNQFDKKKTQPRPFYLDEKNCVKIPIMYQENYFGYYEDSTMNIQALELPYKGGHFSFMVILPGNKGEEAVKTVAGQLRDPDSFQNIVNNIRQEKVQVYLPRMKIESKMDMVDMLKKNNVTEVFNPGSNGLKGITKNPEDLYISEIVQKAFILVDETGTEAAAATGIMVGVTSVMDAPKIFVFDATRRFLYFILLNKVPIFCGAFLGKA